jgi:hypothetical protein
MIKPVMIMCDKHIHQCFATHHDHGTRPDMLSVQTRSNRMF